MVFLTLLPGVRADDAAKAPPAGWGSKTFQLKYASAAQLQRLFSSQAFLIEAESEGNLLTASGPSSFLDQVEQAVKRFDVAPQLAQNLEICVYLLALGNGGNPPAELGDFVKQTGKPFRLADSQIVRMRVGDSGESNSLSAPNGDSPTIGQVRVRIASVNSGASGNVISLEGLRVSLNIPGSAPRADSAIAAAIDVAEKKPVLIGRAGGEKQIAVLVRAEVAN